MYLGLHRWVRCIAEFEQAIRLDPDNAWCHNRLGVAWAWRGGHDDEAIAQYRESIRLDPNIGWTHHHLAVSLERERRFEEAAAEFQEAARLFPEKRAEWKREMRRMLMKLGRGADVHAAWKEELTAHPAEPDDWFGYAELCLFQGNDDEYRRVRSDLLAQFGATNDPDVAERIGRACLLLPPSADELPQAVALTERAVAVGRTGHEFLYPYYRFAEGLARYRQGRFDDAITLMTGDAAQSLGACPRLVLAMALHQQGRSEEARSALEEAIRQSDWTPLSADHHDVWISHILRREAAALIFPDRSSSVEGKNTNETIDAEWSSSRIRRFPACRGRCPRGGCRNHQAAWGTSRRPTVPVPGTVANASTAYAISAWMRSIMIHPLQCEYARYNYLLQQLTECKPHHQLQGTERQ
jgi:serine/threonine-protein kinase